MDKNRIQKFLSSTRVLQFVFFVAAVTGYHYGSTEYDSAVGALFLP